MYRNFFIHSSVDGHLGCFQVLAIIISAVMNIGVHVPFQLWFLRVYAQLWELLDYMVVLFLVFKGITVLFLLVICISLEKYLIQIVSLMGLFVFLWLNLDLYIFWIIGPCQIYDL